MKRGTNAGAVRVRHKLLFLANALKQHHVGLEESGAGVWSLHLGAALVGRVDERTTAVRG